MSKQRASRKARVTIQDIAERADVSKSTVSRVLTGKSHVTAEKREAVSAAIAELDYQPNIHARGLAGGRSLTIGVLTRTFGNPVYDAILRGILDGMNGSDYAPIFADGGWQFEMEQVALETLLARRVDGLIVVGGTGADDRLCRLAERIPLVVVARRIPELEGHCLWVDNFKSAYNATQFLIEAGHRHIAHITGEMTHHDAVQRRDGYVQALADAGLEMNQELIVEGTFQQQAGLLAVEMLLARGQVFSAIFAANDQTALGARLALYRHGIRVPDDVSIIGFDDQSDSAFMTPPLTTMRQPAVEMGEAAAKVILHLLRDEPFETPTFRTELIVRESVRRYR